MEEHLLESVLGEVHENRVAHRVGRCRPLLAGEESDLAQPLPAPNLADHLFATVGVDHDDLQAAARDHVPAVALVPLSEGGLAAAHNDPFDLLLEFVDDLDVHGPEDGRQHARQLAPLKSPTRDVRQRVEHLRGIPAYSIDRGARQLHEFARGVGDHGGQPNTTHDRLHLANGIARLDAPNHDFSARRIARDHAQDPGRKYVHRVPGIPLSHERLTAGEAYVLQGPCNAGNRQIVESFENLDTAKQRLPVFATGVFDDCTSPTVRECGRALNIH